MNIVSRPSLKDYLAAEESFFNSLAAGLGESLLFYCLTGSLGRRDIVEGWSDIDVLFVLDRLTAENLKAIQAALDANSSRIKIGVTFYTVEEFNNQHYKDPKTLVALKLLHEGVFTPRVVRRPVIVPKITNVRINGYELVNYSVILHDLKRNLLKYSAENERSIYKAIMSMIKINLRRRGITCNGYAELIAVAKKELSDCPCDFKLPIEIIDYPERSMERYPEYVKFLNWLKIQESKYADVA